MPLPGGALRSDDDLELFVATMRIKYELSPSECDQLRQVLIHVRDGGIVIQHDDGLVLTWTDGGVSRRLERNRPS